MSLCLFLGASSCLSAANDLQKLKSTCKVQLSTESEEVCAKVAEAAKHIPKNATPAQKRAAINKLFLELAAPGQKVKSVKDFRITSADNHQIPVRNYIPDNARQDHILMYVHGGGWTQGNVETHDGLCRRLANSLRVPVFSVDYRLAPEHSFPTPLNDVSCVFSYLAKHNPNKKIIIAGDSAGGNLCAALCIKIGKEKYPKPCAQILFYPALCADFESRSFQVYENVSALSKAATKAYWIQYAGNEEAIKSNPLIVPILYNDMSVFPKTTIVMAEHDVLADGQRVFKKKLEEASIEVNLIEVKGAVHGCTAYDAAYTKETPRTIEQVKNHVLPN
jgi:acetyl esterase